MGPSAAAVVAVQAPSRRRGRGRGRARGRGSHQPETTERSRSPHQNEYVSRSGRHWQLTAPSNSQVRRRQHNIVSERDGPRGAAARATDMNQIFRAFITDGMIDMIVRHTNEEGVRVFDQWNKVHPDKIREFKLTTANEIWAIIGLMLLRGVYGAYRESVKEMWKSETGRAVFTATMSRSRFETLVRFLRFDDRETRSSRQSADNFAPIREVFDMFNDKCRDNFSLSDNVTVDETLRKFRGRCKFRVYMPQKPGKYGLLFRVLTDATYRYVSRMMPYTGKIANADGRATERQSPTSIVMDLCRHLFGSGRNLTIDRYYTNVEMVEDLVKNHNITVVGTINSNRVHVPEEMKSVIGREVLSTKFVWSGSLMLLSYMPKPKKNVLLLSTQHDQPDISERTDRKPEVILAYNEGKGGVDVVDKMIDTYRSKVSTRRWPMVVFYTIVDISALNAFVIWLHKNPNWNASKGPRLRRIFILELGKSLILPHIKERASDVSGFSVVVQKAMQVMLTGSESMHHSTATSGTCGQVRNCAICIQAGYGKGYKHSKRNANKTKRCCEVCKKPVCGKHSKKSTGVTCNNCKDNSDI